MDLCAHNVRKVSAEVKHSGDTTWIELSVHERWRKSPVQATEVTLFVGGPNAKRKAEAYAAAINNVNALYPDAEPEEEEDAALDLIEHRLSQRESV